MVEERNEGDIRLKQGIIFNIQRYSVHDGPGIRTTVFLKGCPLKCWWCHNPESQLLEEEILFIKNRCKGCGACAKVCPKSAIEISNRIVEFSPEKCIICGKCIEVCAIGAREVAGKKVGVEHVIKEIKKDLIFYDEAGGGVTFSGGEPLLQWEFLYELLVRCKEEGIHTTLDTSGFASWEVIEKLTPYIDLFLYDIKLMDDEEHVKYTGTSNRIILDNLKRLSALGKKINARMPIIPGINNSEKNIRGTGEFLSKYNVHQVNLLPYHSMAKDKYGRLFKEYKLDNTIEPEMCEMLEIKDILIGYGLNVKIGG